MIMQVIEQIKEPATFILIALIFWIGYERFLERVINPIFIEWFFGSKLGNEEKRVVIAKKATAYIGAIVFGFFFFASGFKILSILGVTYSEEDILTQLFDLSITLMIFAGGPDVLHQVMSLIQNTTISKKKETEKK